MKDIVGYERKYAVTEEGQIWSYQNNKFLAQTLNKVTGYYYVGLWINNNNKTVPIHRLVAIAFINPVIGKSVVNHKNGIKTDNNVGNLEWVTKSENEDHAIKTGLRLYTNRLSRDEFIDVLWDIINGESYASASMRVPYKVPFLSTKIRQIAKEIGMVDLLDHSLKEQRIKRACRNLESINN